MFSTVEEYHQYCGKIPSIHVDYSQYFRGCLVLWRDIITAVEDIQKCEGIPSVLWGMPSEVCRVFSTMEIRYYQYCGDNTIVLVVKNL